MRSCHQVGLWAMLLVLMGLSTEAREFPEGVGHRGFRRKLPLSSRLFLALEGKLTAAHTRVDAANGHASVPNVAIHGLVGLGYSF